MLASLMIIVLSGAMLVYWLRYSCLLLRAGRINEMYLERAAQVNGLAIQAIRTNIQDAVNSDGGLRNVHQMLDRDRKVLDFLLAQSQALTGIERGMLRVDYVVMSGASRVGQLMCPSVARFALTQMAATVSCLASAQGQQIANRSNA